MDCAPNPVKQQELLNEILAFIQSTRGLRSSVVESRTRVTQSLDGKHLDFTKDDLESVLVRMDTEGQDFIQINFRSSKKVLMTTALIGFKPLPLKGLDLAKLPRVVTTPDIESVFVAVQDALHAADSDPAEIAVLKKVFEAVILGGEAIGFDLSAERKWMGRIPVQFSETSS